MSRRRSRSRSRRSSPGSTGRASTSGRGWKKSRARRPARRRRDESRRIHVQEDHPRMPSRVRGGRDGRGRPTRARAPLRGLPAMRPVPFDVSGDGQDLENVEAPGDSARAGRNRPLLRAGAPRAGEMSLPAGSRMVLFGLAGLAIFSAIFSYAVFRGWWPTLPPGIFHDVDLWAGFAGGAALLLLLVLRRDSGTSSSE